MSDSRKTFLIELIVGVIASVIISFILGVASAETLAIRFRILSDAFFFSGAMLLAFGGITFSSNEGAFDGLGYSVKVLIDRVRIDYADRRISFAEYREQQRKKAKSPASSLLAGAILAVIGLIFMVVFNYLV